MLDKSSPLSAFQGLFGCGSELLNSWRPLLRIILLVSAVLSPASGLGYLFCRVVAFVSYWWGYFNQIISCRQDKWRPQMLWTHLVFCENSGLNSLSQKRYLHQRICVLLSNQIEYFFLPLWWRNSPQLLWEGRVVFLDTWGYVIFTKYKQ